MLPPDKAAQLIWFDPGTTTGLVLVSIDKEWLDGNGPGGPAGFKRALFSIAHFQLGRYPKDAEFFAEPTKVTLDALHDWDHAPACWREEIASVVGGLDAIRRFPYAAWGYEDFRTRMVNQTDDFLSSPRIGSTLRDSMLLEGRPGFTQLPAVMSEYTPAKLQEAGVYRRGMPHATDAATHALHFYRRARQDRKLRAAAWPHLFGGSK